MLVIVPAAADGLAAVLGGLDGKSVAGWRQAGVLRPRQVNLALPKWTARKPLSLNAALASMGMKKAFAAGVADFSGIDGTRDLFVSAVVHEGFVDVSEEGTEAAAATGVVIGVRSALPPQEEPLEVRADRPFAWAVVHQGTGAMLFAGVVTDPR
jgi:serpin B